MEPILIKENTVLVHLASMMGSDSSYTWRCQDICSLRTRAFTNGLWLLAICFVAFIVSTTIFVPSIYLVYQIIHEGTFHFGMLSEAYTSRLSDSTLKGDEATWLQAGQVFNCLIFFVGGGGFLAKKILDFLFTLVEANHRRRERIKEHGSLILAYKAWRDRICIPVKYE